MTFRASAYAASLSLFVLGLAGCAAPGGRVPLDAVQSKTEALVGAPCTGDEACDAGEYCDLLLCIPERECPNTGVCRNVTRFYDNEGGDIPDNEPEGLVSIIDVDRPAAAVASAHVALTVEHPWRGDLRVTLRSPSGTEHVLHDRLGGGEDDLLISRDVTEVFEGDDAVGPWILVVSDNASRDTGRLVTWRLELDYAEPSVEPEPSTDIWASMQVPNVETAHPYANDTHQEWDLRPYTAGAPRSRLTFERIDVERGYDYVEVFDQDSGEVLDRFTGQLDAFTTREYETGALGVRFVSDYSVTSWGFVLDRAEVFGMGCLADDECPAGTQCPNELVRCIRWPCFLSCQPVVPGGEGEGCTGDRDCEDDLYCAADGFCRPDGSCTEVADCTDPSNPWLHVQCAGRASCDAGACTWSCEGPLACTEGETTNDGCNTCQCSGGHWLCTQRYCPPVAAAGEACSEATVCDEGLSCDRGPAENGTCGDTREGVCVTEGTRRCRAPHDPVCSCTGQTFRNECERQGSGAAWAHHGECTYAVAIPDADIDGVGQRLDIVAPANSTSAEVEIRIDHTYRGDLEVWLEAPDSSRHVLWDRAGGSADDLEIATRVEAEEISGTWTLHVIDHARWDTGVLRYFNVAGE